MYGNPMKAAPVYARDEQSVCAKAQSPLVTQELERVEGRFASLVSELEELHTRLAPVTRAADPSPPTPSSAQLGYGVEFADRLSRLDDKIAAVRAAISGLIQRLEI